MRRAIKFHDLELSELHLDALKEICNIGMGHAATALNQMIGKTIRLAVPVVELAPVAELLRRMGGEEKTVLSVFISVYGEIQGRMLLVFPPESAKAICLILTGDAPSDHEPLSEMHESALRELGNILASSYLGALERLLNKTLLPSVPKVERDQAGSLIKSLLGEQESEEELVMLVEGSFINREDGIHGRFYLVPDPKSLPILFQAAKLAEQTS